MESHLTRLIVVAAGTKAEIQRWSKALSADSIEYSLVQPCFASGSDSKDHWEVWVNGADVTRARANIRAMNRSAGTPRRSPRLDSDTDPPSRPGRVPGRSHFGPQATA
jgi:hypothetical protein